MIEAEWWDYDDADELAEAVAGDVAFIIESALDARGDALIALPADPVALPIFEKLAEAKLNWKRVTIVPTDERIVPLTDPMCNVAKLARIFLPLGARVIPIISEAAADHKAAGSAANARLDDFKWPLDLAWLGTGADGHVAALYAGPDLDEAIEAPASRRAIGLMPDPLPADAPVARVSLTRSAILSARTILLVGAGNARETIEQAIESGARSDLPVGRVFADCETPIDIHWLD